MTDEPQSSSSSSNERLITRERVIAAPADKIFAVIADPRRHPDIDGSGSVKGAVDAPDSLKLGSKFGMNMKVGIPYKMINEVVEFEPDRRIAWAPHISILGREIRFGSGRIWRYELEARDDGTTLVRETWDGTKEAGFALQKRAGLPQKTAEALDQTLLRLDHVVTGEAS